MSKLHYLTLTTPATDINPVGAIDFVGTGSANAFEGDSAAKVMSNTTSAQRRPYSKVDPPPSKGNAWDTNQNGDDFYVGKVAAPRNTASQIEAPMVPIISLDPNGDKIQFLKEGSTVFVKGAPEAAVAQSTINVYEGENKGTALGTAIVAENGSFDISFTTETALTSVYVAAIQGDMEESKGIRVQLAVASSSVDASKLSYSVDKDGTGSY